MDFLVVGSICHLLRKMATDDERCPYGCPTGKECFQRSKFAQTWTTASGSTVYDIVLHKIAHASAGPTRISPSQRDVVNSSSWIAIGSKED